MDYEVVGTPVEKDAELGIDLCMKLARGILEKFPQFKCKKEGWTIKRTIAFANLIGWILHHGPKKEITVHLHKKAFGTTSDYQSWHKMMTALDVNHVNFSAFWEAFILNGDYGACYVEKGYSYGGDYWRATKFKTRPIWKWLWPLAKEAGLTRGEKVLIYLAAYGGLYNEVFPPKYPKPDMRGRVYAKYKDENGDKIIKEKDDAKELKTLERINALWDNISDDPSVVALVHRCWDYRRQYQDPDFKMGGRFYSRFTSVRRADRHHLMKLFFCHEADLPSAVPNTLWLKEGNDDFYPDFYTPMGAEVCRYIEIDHEVYGRPLGRALKHFFLALLNAEPKHNMNGKMIKALLNAGIYGSEDLDGDWRAYCESLDIIPPPPKPQWDNKEKKLTEAVIQDAMIRAFPFLKKYIKAYPVWGETQLAESKALSQLVPLLESKNLVPFLVYDAVYVPLEFRDRALERFKELLKVEARKLVERIA